MTGFKFLVGLSADDTRAGYLKVEGGEVECCGCGRLVYTSPSNVPNIRAKKFYAICPPCSEKIGWRKDGSKPDVAPVEELERLIKCLEQRDGQRPPQTG